MSAQEEIELKNIVCGLICMVFPKAIKKIHEGYDEISRSVLDMLVKHGIPDDVEAEKILGDSLMHLMREGMVDKIYEQDRNRRAGTNQCELPHTYPFGND